MVSYSDGEIVEILQKGETFERNDVIRQLYKSCYAVVLNFVLKNSGTKNDCEDVFQQTMEVFYNQIQRNRFNKESSITTYFCGIAKNLWYGHLRKRKKIHVSIDIDLQIADEEPTSDHNNLKLFYSLFDRLEEDCRKILKFFYFERLSMKEITSKFNTLKNEQSVRTKKYRCLKHLIGIFRENKITQSNFV